MKNVTSYAVSILIASFAVSSTSLKAEKIDETKYNTPEVFFTQGEGARKNFVGIKLQEAPLIVRSAPIEAYVVLTVYRDRDNYNILRCKTPCLFKITNATPFTLGVENPAGYQRTSKPVAVEWATGWTKWKLKPNDITYTFIPE